MSEAAFIRQLGTYSNVGGERSRWALLSGYRAALLVRERGFAPGEDMTEELRARLLTVVDDQLARLRRAGEGP